MHVSSRVDRIRQSAHLSQWRYVSTDSNPADLATRGINITEIENSLWMQGPSFLFKEIECSQAEFPLIDADSDKEVKPLININKNQLDHNEKPSIVKTREVFQLEKNPCVSIISQTYSSQF